MMLATETFPLLLLTAAAFCQAPASGLRFEVASVKSALSPREMRLQGQAVPSSASNAARVQIYDSLGGLIRKAYQVEPGQKVVGPDWIGTTWFLLMAKLPDGTKQEQVPQMLQVLLAERFDLVVRREAKEEPVYVLTVDKGGTSLKEAAPDASPSSDGRSKLGGRAMVLRSATSKGWLIYSQINGDFVMDANSISMPELALALRTEVGRSVLDHTGLNGFYEVSIPVSATWLSSGSEPSGTNIFKSIEKLGLVLQKSKASISSLVVERVAKVPTGN
jgi:uncharacterized protein (TIGR03435 family)